MYGICPICGKRKRLTRHHIKKWVVFHDDNIDNHFYLCERCHNQGKMCLEELIRERENNLLRKHPELYTQALDDYIKGIRAEVKIYAKKKRR